MNLTPKKIFIVACEPSGDSHGAELMTEMLREESGIEFRGLGGPKIQRAGAVLLQDMTQMSALGFGDVVRQYFKYRKIFYATLKAITEWKPDAVIVIDSPAFNLRLAKKINNRFPVLYYISPQLWAWGRRRVHVVKKFVRKVYTIIPFEESFYQKYDVPCEFVGSPLLDQTTVSKTKEELRKEFKINQGFQAIGILPGSRESEVKRILPLMLKTCEELERQGNPKKFFLTQSPNVPGQIYDKILKRFPKLPVQRFDTRFHDVLYAVDFALIASGTTTTEATLLGTPFFLFYKTSFSTYWIGKILIKVPFLGLVNLLAEKRVVPEFIQKDIHPKTIAHEAQFLLDNEEFYQKMKNEFVLVKKMFGEKGASRRAAHSILSFFSEHPRKPAKQTQDHESRVSVQ